MPLAKVACLTDVFFPSYRQKLRNSPSPHCFSLFLMFEVHKCKKKYQALASLNLKQYILETIF